MFAKLVVLVVMFGLCGAGLLAMRQSRLQSVHELTASRLRVRAHQEQLQRLKAEIASKTSPDALRQMFEARPEVLDSLRPAVDRQGLLPTPDAAFLEALDREAGAATPAVPGNDGWLGSDA